MSIPQPEPKTDPATVRSARIQIGAGIVGVIILVGLAVTVFDGIVSIAILVLALADILVFLVLFGRTALGMPPRAAKRRS